ncbi:MAG: TonB-dependent receptor [Candidatus Marinimicrobia bacterium]|nr:TonB-dependent receptor [Candidatus Neomarinimicrobiota bacterium]
MKKFLLFMFLCFIISPYLIFAANTGKISGKVTDNSTGESLIGANIVIEGTFMGAATGMDGSYFILNIPPGKYNVRAEVIGYKILLQQNVQVMADLTTKIDFALEQTVLEGERVVVEAKRPIIQPDLTASRNIVTADEIANIPVEDIEGIVNLTAGFVGGHARGGRNGEVVYLVDGVTTMDPITGGFDTDIPELAVEEVSIITSGFSAEFSNAQSGIVNIVMKEGGSYYTGKVKYKTSDFGDFKDYEFDEENGTYKPTSGISDMHRLKNFECSFGGPLPYLGKMTTFHLAAEVFNDEGRYPKNYDHSTTLSGKLAFLPFSRDKVTLSGNYAIGKQGSYSHLWSRITDEDKLPQYEPLESNPSALDVWYGDGQLNTEDVNGDGILEENEDLNFNGILDTEDLNRDGLLTKYDMLEHLREYDLNSYNVSGAWNHTISNKSFLKLQFGVYRTYMKYNIKENINEDANHNGILDIEWDKNGNGILDIDEDLNGNGIWDYEDLNGNGILDGPGIDMFTDANNDGIIDESELTGQDSLDYIAAGGNPGRLFMPWEDCPFGSEKDRDGFFIYGTGAGYYRLRWNEDDKITYSTKLLYNNQINKNHYLQLGVEGKIWDIFDHDIDLASGGNVYGQNIGVREGWGEEEQKAIQPYSYGLFAEDKMEFDEFIVNLGFRYDYFNPNWDNYPKDLDNPVVDETIGGEVLDPIKVKAKNYFSPRLGIAFPVSERDRFYFNYGKMFQLPIMSYMYRNINWDFSGAFPMVGNPDIKPETTIYYEIGVEHRMGLNWKIKAVGFYKDIKGLTDTRRYFYTASNYYTIQYNIDYGKTQGFELTLDKRLSNYFGGYINYTYSIAVGKSSSARQNYSLIWAGTIVPKEESYLDWDQRHTINSNVYFRVGKEDAPFGLKLLRNFSTNFILRYGSGLPYSPPQRTRETEINTKRRLPTYSVDMSIEKRFDIGPVSLSAFIWIKNLTNHKNVTGIADVEWYQLYGDTNKDGTVDGKDDYKEVLSAARGKYNNPGYNSEARTIRIGIGLDF